MSKKDWQLLKAYMATGMAPEDFQRLKLERNALLDLAPMDELCECCTEEFCDNCDAGDRWKLRRNDHERCNGI